MPEVAAGSLCCIYTYNYMCTYTHIRMYYLLAHADDLHCLGQLPCRVHQANARFLLCWLCVRYDCTCCFVGLLSWCSVEKDCWLMFALWHAVLARQPVLLAKTTLTYTTKRPRLPQAFSHSPSCYFGVTTFCLPQKCASACSKHGQLLATDEKSVAKQPAL